MGHQRISTAGAGGSEVEPEASARTIAGPSHRRHPARGAVTRTGSLGYRRRRRVRVVATPVAAMALAVALSAAGAVSSVSTAAAQPAGPDRDFATEVLGDPWDFSNPEDALLAHGPPVSLYVTDAGLTGDGTYRWTSDGGFVDLHPMTVPGALPDSRDGRWNPVDADTYSHVSLRLRASREQAFRVAWFVCTNDYPGCDRWYDFRVQEGWHTYTLPMRELSDDWRGQLQGIRLASGGGATTFELDWLRIHPAGSSATPPAGAPQPRVLTPDAEGGDDFATLVLGNPWDLADAGDLTGTANLSGGRFAGGAFHATNAPPEQNNPYVTFSPGPGIDPSRYHLLTVETTYDGAFGLGFEPGGGMHGRWLFRRADAGLPWINSRELVTYPSRPRVTYDLEEGRFGPTTEPGNRPWTGSLITGLRWDANEDPGRRSWRLHEVRLAAPHEASGLFEVAWEDPAHTDGTVVEVGASARRGDFSTAPLRTGIRQRAGVNRVTIDTSGLPPGERWVWVRAAAPNGVTTQSVANGPLVVTGRVAGRDRVDTALQLSRIGWPQPGATSADGGGSTDGAGGGDEPDGAGGAVIASATAFPDALAGVQLADAVDGPLLLTAPGALDPRVTSELRRLRPQRVYVLGGWRALSGDVERAARAAVPEATVARLAGTDRYETAARIATAAVDRWRAAGRTVAEDVVLASGMTFPDALAAGPLVAATTTPLLLTTPGSLPAATARTLEELDARSVTVVGGPAAVSDQAARSSGRPVRRIAGSDRYDTARRLAAAATAAGASPARTVVALGENFPDALGAGAFAARTGETLVLTGRATLPAPTRQWLDQDAVMRAVVVGGRAAVSDPTVAAIHTAAAR